MASSIGRQTPQSLPPVAAVHIPTPPPSMPPIMSLQMGVHPTPPPGQFPPVPGSGSGPSHPAMQMPMRPSDASYPSYPSYPRYEPPATGDVQLKPNRRPLLIGLGIIIVGAAVIIAMSIGAS